MGLYTDSVTRAYYAAFSAVTLLHYLAGNSYSSHRQILGQFNKQFIHTGIFNQTRDPDYFADKWMQSDAPVVKTIDQLFDPGGVGTISGRSFCFTGQMESGTRKEVEAELEKHGGEPAKSPPVSYLRTLHWSTKNYSAFSFRLLLHRFGRDDSVAIESVSSESYLRCPSQ
ncbi:MAG: hypothetical protein ACOCYG_09145, partial [Spirochaetota bacterium]